MEQQTLTNIDPAPVEPSHGDVEPLTLWSQQVGTWHSAVVKWHDASRMTVPTNLKNTS